MPLLQNPFGIHERALTLRDMRTTILAANMANADTPNYKARDIDFRSLMQGTANAQMMLSTDRQHMQPTFAAAGGILMWRVATSAALDGNTVHADTVQNHYADNAMRIQATLTFLHSRIKGIRTALRGE